MVQRQFLGKLEGLGVRRIDVGGAAFDPSQHEAVATVPARTPDEDGQVVGVVRQGYTIGADDPATGIGGRRQDPGLTLLTLPGSRRDRTARP